MTVEEARKIAKNFDTLDNPTEEDIFLYAEAMDYLITTTKDPYAMMGLGGWYYARKQFDLARKYYEMASAYDIDEADECLGYIFYYGRTGERDFEKAFQHYSRSRKRGNLVSAYKVADMYKNGYFIKKDYDKYKEIIESLYPKVKKAKYLSEPLPEVFTRLARIRKEEGNMEEAASLYLQAKDFLAQRICYNPFWGNLNIMKWLIDDLYTIIEFNPDDIDFYDLYYVLNHPAKVTFYYDEKLCNLESSLEDGAVVVHFNDKWFHDRDEFFQKVMIGDQKLTSIYKDLYGFEVTLPKEA